MKRVLKYASLLFAGTAVMVACSKKSDDPTPDDNTPAQTGDNVCLAGQKTNILIDASTSSGAASYAKNYTCNVTTSQGYDTLVLDVKAQKDMDKIYVTLSQDNGPATPVTIPDQVGFDPASNTYGKTFKGGSTDYTLDIPDGLSSTKYIKVKIPVSVSSNTSRVTDVYTIWITNGTGSFTTYTKGSVVIGPLSVTLKYKDASNVYTKITGTVGDQNNAKPSYIVTVGNGGTVAGAVIKTEADSAEVFKSIDINFVGLNAAGNALGNTPYLLSPNQRKSVGFTANVYTTNTSTKFAAYTGSTSFDSFSGADINGLPNPTADRVAVANDKIYVFSTQDGRKGIIHLKNLSTTSSSSADFEIKVLTVPSL